MLLVVAMLLPAAAQKLTKLYCVNETVLPYALQVDSLNVEKKAYDPSQVLTNLFTPNLRGVPTHVINANAHAFFAPQLNNKQGQGVLSTYCFYISATHYGKVQIKVYSRSRMALFSEDKKLGEQLNTTATDTVPGIKATIALTPGVSRYFVRHLQLHADTVPQLFAVEVTPEPKSKVKYTFSTDGDKVITPQLLTTGRALSSVKYSPSGKYCILTSAKMDGNAALFTAKMYNDKGEVVRNDVDPYSNWMPNEDRLYYVKTLSGKRYLYTANPMGGDEQLLYSHLPKGNFSFTPDGKRIVIYIEQEGDKKDDKVRFVRDPNDRMPGWRNGAEVCIIDLASSTIMPIAVGKSNLFLTDVDALGNILFLKQHTNWKQEPYDFVDLYLYHPQTGETDTLVRNDVDLSMAKFLPDGHSIVVKGSPNSFGGVGSQLGTRRANSFEGELFIYDVNTRKARCITKDFDPSVSTYKMDSKGRIFISADNGSRLPLYCFDGKSISKLPASEEYITNFSIPKDGSKVAYIGQSATNSYRCKVIQKGREKLLFDLDAITMKGFIRPVVKDFAFSYNGTPIEAWYVLPPHFDPNKKYPLLVYYYGGTTPTHRYVEGRWSLPMFAAQGYVVLSLNPSGCIGYGQEYAARHLNAWGEPTASEIIACIKSFAAQNSFIDAKHIGCFGASYGGFMTEYLVSKTDLFAAAISHAGISSISNYWGSGYWGMGYNAVAAYNSYPWNRKDIYVERSPLFRADKIHTPLLLLHGDQDTNVPTAESVNLYNALKVLGREVAFVEFTKQDHVIVEAQRRQAWYQTMLAWFAKYLQGDAAWWNDLYGKDTQ